MDPKTHSDFHELKNFSANTDSSFAPIFYGTIAFVPAYFLDGLVLLHVVTFAIVYFIWIGYGLTLFKGLSFGTKFMLASTESLSAVVSMNAVEYGLNIGTHPIYAFSAGAIAYLLFLHFVASRIARLYFSSNDGQADQS